MARRSTPALAQAVVNVTLRLELIEADLRSYGDVELADAIKRARRELSTQHVTGILSQVGV